MTEQKLLVVIPPTEEKNAEGDKTGRMENVLNRAISGVACDILHTAEELEHYIEENRCRPSGQRTLRLLFALSLGKTGTSLEYCRMLTLLRKKEKSDFLEGFSAGLLVDADSELYTKSTATELAFAAVCAGCAFVGKPLVEGTQNLWNFSVTARNMEVDLFTAYRESARLLVQKIMQSEFPVHEKPEILVLHASSHETSNTFAIWDRIRQELTDTSITEIGLRNGTLSDCSGCPYKMCLHFGERGSCFYGGVMVEEVYPAVKKADAVILLCPNYNDALSANLTAFINRLTALFRISSFHEKAVFAVVVSGYSGSDIVARQIISALNMNKAFYLPGRSMLLVTANDAGSAMKQPGIEARIQEFSFTVRAVLKGRRA